MLWSIRVLLSLQRVAKSQAGAVSGRELLGAGSDIESVR